MATKTINVRFQLENQSEFKSKLTELNTALAAHKSEVALVSAKYNDSTRTSEALQKVIDTQKSKLELLNGAFEQAQKATEGLAEKSRELSAEIERVNNGKNGGAKSLCKGKLRLLQCSLWRKNQHTILRHFCIVTHCPLPTTSFQ